MYEPGTCSAMGREHIVRTMLFKRFDMISTLDLQTWFIATGHSLPIAIDLSIYGCKPDLAKG